MNNKISPKVNERILELCNDETLCSIYSSKKQIEVHRPFFMRSTNPVLLNGCYPFIAIIHRLKDGESTVEKWGHFNYDGQRDGNPLNRTILNQYAADFFECEYYKENKTEIKLFFNDLTAALYRPDGPVTGELEDWSKTTYDGKYLIAPIDEDLIWQTGEEIITKELDLNRTIEEFIKLYRSFAEDRIDDVNNKDAYIVREAKIFDVQERAEELYINSPPVTEEQAVSWSMAERGFNQEAIAHLRKKAQSTIQDHISRAEKHRLSAEQTMNAFDEPGNYFNPTINKNVIRKLYEDIETRRFNLNKKLQVDDFKCPKCGFDVEDLVESNGSNRENNHLKSFNVVAFYIGRKKSNPRKDSSISTHVECSKCGFIDQENIFKSAWKEEHGESENKNPDSIN